MQLPNGITFVIKIIIIGNKLVYKIQIILYHKT